MRLMAPLLCLLLIACEPTQFVRSNSVTVKAELSGVSASNDNRKQLMLLHNEDGETERLVELESGAPIYNLNLLQLWVDESTGLIPFKEEFAYLSISSTQKKPNALGSAWVRNRIGDIAVLRVRKDDIQLERMLFGQFPSAEKQRYPGSHYLTRIEHDDRKLPWKIAPSDSRCAPLAREKTWYPSLTAEDDCFDLETLAGILLANFSVRVTEALWDTDQSPIDLNASNHNLYMVPHVTLERENYSPLPGFGFIYQTDITGFGFHATVEVPVAFHYANGEMIIDPLSDGDNEFVSTERIRVVSHSLPADFSLELIQNLVTSAIANTELPAVRVGTSVDGNPITMPLDRAMRVLTQLVTGDPPITTPTPSIIALPKQRVTRKTTLTNKVMYIHAIEEAYKRAPTGMLDVSINGNQILVPSVIPNDPFNRERVTRISGMVPQTPFELYFLE